MLHPSLLPDLFIALGFCLALALGAIITPQILFLSHKKKLYDVPNERKLHQTPVPSLGGVAFVPTILIAFGSVIALRVHLGMSIAATDMDFTLLRLLSLMIGMMVLYFVGLVDDLIGVSYKTKFSIQIIVGLILAFSGCWLNDAHGLFGFHGIPLWVGIPLTVFTVIYITNAINLIDGIDGLASGLCALALAAFTWLFAKEGQYYNALISSCTLGVIIPFWYSNVFGSAQRGHKLFMGDTGSLTLGIILSYLAISACHSSPDLPHSNRDAVIAFSILFIPLIDVVRVVIHRLRHGRNPFLPDRNHFHHKLLRTGMAPWLVLITILTYCLFFLGLNLLLAPLMNLTWVILIDLTLWTLSQGIFTLLGGRAISKKTQAQNV